MIRRFNGGRVPRSMATNAVAVISSQQVRSFHSIGSLASSLVMMTVCVLFGGSWANNFMNCKKYGRWRFRNLIDDVIMVEDFKYARWVGGFLGFLFYWFVVGPKKYHFSDLEHIPGNKRFGPF